jgi:glycosyltransferase involved in cell wall biosynthesis
MQRDEIAVSVGIPTYNYPEGLKKTLECLINQTHKNLQIIVSNNHSENPEVGILLKAYKLKDPRIEYYIQDKNIGASKNFEFVLSKATGKYFMWAADDDLRESDCIEYYLRNIGEASAIFSTYAILNNYKKNEFLIANDLPLLSGTNRKEDLKKFLKSLCPSMIYGMFKRDLLIIAFERMDFDWGDCFVLIKFISSNGFKTILSPTPKYFAGINGKEYMAKPVNGNYLNPFKYFFKSLPYILPYGYPACKSHFIMCKNAWKARYNIKRNIFN